jgi:hypothetical protein
VLRSISKADCENCPFQDANGNYIERKGNPSSSSSRARALEALARLEAPLVDPDYGRLSSSSRRHLPRHKMELPHERAQRFATVTGPWKDSGVIPATIDTQTMLPGTQFNDRTSTGAMVEFLGGEIGAHLPFVSDAATSVIPLLPEDNCLDWQAGEAAPLDDAILMQDLDELIAATSTAPPAMLSQLPTAAPPPLANDGLGFGTSSGDGFDTDLVMDDLDFDDVTFGSAFDMPFK